MKSILRSIFALLVLGGLPAFADPVWDPTEIARLGEQSAQLANNLSAIIDNLQAFDRLAVQIGPLGARSSSVSQIPASLRNYGALSSAGVPSGNDAFQFVSGPKLTATQQQQIKQRWDAAYQKVAAEGFAVAQIANQDGSLANGRSQALGATAAAAQDLRGDVQANSSVCLAVLTELGSVHAVLALLLEQQALGHFVTIRSGG